MLVDYFPQSSFSDNPVSFSSFSQAVEMTLDDIPLFLFLQQKAWESLKENQKHFMKLRTEDDLALHLQFAMAAFALRDVEGGWVAQGLLADPGKTEAVKNLTGYPIHPDEQGVVVVQALSVDPAVRGQGLSGKILHAAKETAFSKGFGRMVAKIADDNEPSKSCFRKSGFVKLCGGSDPNYGHLVSYWEFNLR